MFPVWAVQHYDDVLWRGGRPCLLALRGANQATACKEATCPGGHPFGIFVTLVFLVNELSSSAGGLEGHGDTIYGSHFQTITQKAIRSRFCRTEKDSNDMPSQLTLWRGEHDLLRLSTSNAIIHNIHFGYLLDAFRHGPRCSTQCLTMLPPEFIPTSERRHSLRQRTPQGEPFFVVPSLCRMIEDAGLITCQQCQSRPSIPKNQEFLRPSRIGWIQQRRHGPLLYSP